MAAKVVFILEKEIQRPGRNACVGAYFSQRSFHISLFREFSQRTFQQLFSRFKFVAHFVTVLTTLRNTVILAQILALVNRPALISA